MSAALVAVPGVPKLLSYALTPEQNDAAIGSEVIIELGRREAKGWLIDKVSAEGAFAKPQNAASPQLALFELPAATQKLKPVRICDRDFLPDQLPLFYWMAEYYGVPLVDVIDNAIPRKHQRQPILVAKVAADAWSKQDAVDKLSRRAPEQAKVFAALSAGGPLPVSRLVVEMGLSRAAVTALKKKCLIDVVEELPNGPVFSHAAGAFGSEKPSQLTVSQEKALENILPTLVNKQFLPFLLMGVTGSGKTEVYLRIVEEALRLNRTALIIVPEIALTPQLIDQFRSRLSTPIALLHSQLTDAERWAAWESLLRGDIRVALGPRSAIFAPITDLGVIIVDEEHESSYKQSDGLRYHGRDVAVMRAKFASCPIVLGSATPSFESLQNVSEGRYRLLELPSRVASRPLPTIEIVNLNEIKRADMPATNVSPQLYQALQETLAQKQQAAILYNRRGFSTYFQCDTCEQVLLCSNCSVALVYHQRKHQLLCHYCGATRTPPSHCIYCRDPRTTSVDVDAEGNFVNRLKEIDKVGLLRQVGSGTERVVDELTALFPDARIVRMDRDTMTTKESYREALSTMKTGEADILVGTQMIAKGHDLPGVTLVGIVDADVGLHLPDFRSSEKAFQLITQASGRAGRGTEPGRVLVQTREPHHPTIVAAATSRFRAFARYELEYRKSLGYPPWARLLRVLVSSPNLQEAFHGAEVVTKVLRELVARKEVATENDSVKTTVLGPAPAPHERLRGRHRWHLIIKSSSRKVISQLAAEVYAWRTTVNGFSDLRVTVDVDPVDML